MLPVARHLARLGGVANRTQLLRAGYGDAILRAAIAGGEMRRVRRGWFAVGTAHPEIIRGVAAGGRLACCCALAARGVWVLHDDRRLHVAVGRGSRVAEAAGLVRHHRMLAAPIQPDSPIESVAEALEQLFHCGSPIAAVIAIDSALNLKLVRLDAIRRALGTTVRAKWVLSRVDNHSQSGTETIVRVALRGLRVPVQPQVSIDGVGRVDLVVGDRLVVELDSRAWHDNDDQFEEDRRRDSALVARGYLVLRYTYRRVMDDWPTIQREILAVVRRGDHLWRGRLRNSH